MSGLSEPTWLITGASSGLGKALAEAVVARGWNAVLTARDPARLSGIGEGRDNVLRLKLDVTESGAAEKVRDASLEHFGGIDFLVNSAGYGYLAPVEEGDSVEIERMFAINVFGALATIRSVLPVMRTRRSGMIINISSLGGLMAGAGSGYYGATKFALEAISEALYAEVNALGIKVMVANPSALRTDWLARSLTSPTMVLPEYQKTVGDMLASLPAANGRQPGDPVRAAEVIIEAATASLSPRNLMLGNRAVDVIREKIARLSKDISEWEDRSRSVDYVEGMER